MGLYISSLHVLYIGISFHSLVSTGEMRWAYIWHSTCLYIGISFHSLVSTGEMRWAYIWHSTCLYIGISFHLLVSTDGMRWAYILAAYMFIYRYLIPLVSVNGWNEMGLYMSRLTCLYRGIPFHSLVSTGGMRWAYILAAYMFIYRYLIPLVSVNG